MLYSLDSGKYIEDGYIPHPIQYNIWRPRISDLEYSKIMAAFNSRIEGKRIDTSSWIPGSDWTGTVYEPIYSKACQMNREQAAKFFGLLLWEFFRNHEDVWSFGRYEKNELPIEGMTYFKLTNPPSP